MLSFKKFKLSIQIIRTLFVICLWFIFFQFCYHTYEFYQFNQQFFYQVLDIRVLEKQFQHVIQLSLQYFSMFGWMVLKLFCISVSYFIFNRLPIPTSFINKWFQEKDLSPILSRFLVWHYRRNRTLNIIEFVDCYYWSTVEQYHLNLHLSNPNLAPLFHSFDVSWEKDKN